MKSNFSIQGVLMLLLTLICVTLVFAGLNIALKKTAWHQNRRKKIFFITTTLIVIWIGVLTTLSFKGFFSDFSNLPPRPALAMIIPLPFILLIAFSKKGTALLQLIPAGWLVWTQSFRIAVEVLLFIAFIGGKLPVQMTFEGRNFDVLTGILAIPVGYLLARKKFYASKLAIIFNIIGVLLLVNILVIAVLSMPSSIRYFINEPSNSLVAEFPFILLPGVLVPLAYTLHIFSLRQLLTNKAVQLNQSKSLAHS